MSRLVFVLFGALFGFLLSHARATDFATIERMFLLQEFHLFGVIGVAIATAAVGLRLLQSQGARAWGGAPVRLKQKPWDRRVFTGGLVFGVGWALCGTCPGTALAQLGEGKLYALATVAGILLGTWLQRRGAARTGGTATAAVVEPR